MTTSMRAPSQASWPHAPWLVRGGLFPCATTCRVWVDDSVGGLNGVQQAPAPTKRVVVKEKVVVGQPPPVTGVVTQVPDDANIRDR
ncbi:hypothetical protein GA0061105_12245 [Rhizobium aethiopicum]|uniref:Uncharacterized protein n=1 Tax=Rhizobium aethiopicum TaxID=1138170 RepID=A0A1C3YBA6_9HYPH|nr:hypothetical protein GA0061105_12245 [Rhizobium aethiopicum]